MALTEIRVLPEQGSYSVEYSKSALAVSLDGGRSRFGAHIKNGAEFVNVQYSLNQHDYQYFKAFYNTVTKKGALPFLSKLYLHSADLTTHKCKFVKDSVRLTNQRGNSFIVSATLEVSPNAS
jgi:hypothetical protein